QCGRHARNLGWRGASWRRRRLVRRRAGQTRTGRVHRQLRSVPRTDARRRHRTGTRGFALRRPLERQEPCRTLRQDSDHDAGERSRVAHTGADGRCRRAGAEHKSLSRRFHRTDSRRCAPEKDAARRAAAKIVGDRVSMKASTRWVLGVVSAWVAAMAAVITVSGAQQPSSPTVPQGDKSAQQIAFERFQRAERVMNGSCSATGCHTIRPIQTAAKDQEGWTKTVDAMVEKGAKLELPDDKEILIQYLVQQHGPLPEGEGKAILLNTCTICHDLQRV